MRVDDKKDDENWVDYYMRAYDYPPVLAKACCDPFAYMAIMQNGTHIYFEKAGAISYDWVHLNAVRWADGPCGDCQTAIFDRGMDVRVGDIAILIDAPYGS